GDPRHADAYPCQARRVGTASGGTGSPKRRGFANLVALATVYSRAQVGLDALPVTVEVDISGGLPALTIVGLPETAVKESKDRVRAAIRNSGYRFPDRRLTINLAPADLPKEGGRFDLAIALGILAASGQMPADDLQQYEFLGELSLTGHLRGVRGGLPSAMAAQARRRTLVLPQDNGAEAALAGNEFIRCAGHLAEVSASLVGTSQWTTPAVPEQAANVAGAADMAEVRGQ